MEDKDKRRLDELLARKNDLNEVEKKELAELEKLNLETNQPKDGKPQNGR